jgi:GAF domain
LKRWEKLAHCPNRISQSSSSLFLPDHTLPHAPDRFKKQAGFTGIVAQNALRKMALCCSNEDARLAATRACHPVPSKALDEITTLLAQLFQVDMAFVSIIDDTEVHLVSKAGAASLGVLGDCVPRRGAVCDSVLATTRPEVVVVEDATKDARFCNNQMVVNPPHLRFFACCPLVRGCLWACINGGLVPCWS